MSLLTEPATRPSERSFNPYTQNGGTILAIAGADFSVVAGDTRQSEGFNIQTRYAPKVFRLTDRAVLAVNGFAADGNMFVKKVKQRLEWYRHAHAKDMPLRSIARMIQTMLYGHRFFPYYVYNILGGIEEDGTGAVYSFDPVGSYERETCRAAGPAQSLVQPFLDNQIYFKNQLPAPGTVHPTHLPLEVVLAIVIDSFTSATERHIEVSGVVCCIADAQPCDRLEMALRCTLFYPRDGVCRDWRVCVVHRN
ncbi:20S proteasome subunit [Scleroderma yunnanense]